MQDTGETLAKWLEGRCREEGLTLRGAAAKTGLSHATISDIIKGGHPSAESIRKLALAFGGNGHQRLALEDTLLSLTGLRSAPPRGNLNESIAGLIDKLNQFNGPQLRIMERFADFVSEMEVK